MNCPKCGSELEFISGDFGTGVFTPDGVEEIRYEEGFSCPRCHMILDADDLEDEPEEHDGGYRAFCQEQSEL